MNVKFTYLYRDAGNYKTWYDVVFPNRTGKTAERLTEEIKKHLISGEYFDQALAPSDREEAYGSIIETCS
jgi:hypothetical protein